MQVVFDIGGTKTRMGISWDGATVTDGQSFATAQDFETQMQEMKKRIDEFAKKEPIAAVGGGIAGVLDSKKNKLLASPNLPLWVGKALGNKLTKMTGSKVILDNDAVMEGVGEARMGAGRRRSIVAYMTIGTGIGGCKIVDGEVEAKKWGFEPGHQIIAWGEEVAYLEDFASGTAMAKMYGERAEAIDDPEAWDKEARLLAIGLHNITMLWSPEMIILGGAVTKKLDLEKIKQYMSEQLVMFPEIPEVVRGELGDQAGLVGSLVRLGRGV